MRVVLLIAAFFLSGCIEYSTPLCTDDKLADVPGFEGKFKAHGWVDFLVQTSEIEVKKVSTGSYSVDADGKTGVLKTCKFGNDYISESKTETGNNAGWVIRPLQGGGMTASLLILGTDTLDKYGVPYQIINAPELKAVPSKWKNLFRAQNAENEEVKIKTLVIDNSQEQSQKVMWENAVGTSFGVSWSKQ